MTRTLRAIDMSRKIRDSLMYPRKMYVEGPTFRVCEIADLRLWCSFQILERIHRSVPWILEEERKMKFFFPSTQLCIPLDENILPTFSFLYLVQVQLVSPFLLQNIERNLIRSSTIYTYRTSRSFLPEFMTTHHVLFYHYLSWVCNRYPPFNRRRNFWRMEFAFSLQFLAGGKKFYSRAGSTRWQLRVGLKRHINRGGGGRADKER